MDKPDIPPSIFEPIKKLQKKPTETGRKQPPKQNLDEYLSPRFVSTYFSNK